MRIICLVILISCYCDDLLARTDGSATKLYLLHDSDHRQWCAYTQETNWKTDVEKLAARTVATVEIDGRQINTIHVSRSDKSGDWLIVDSYRVDRFRQLKQLKRETKVIPEDLNDEKFYSRKGQRLLLDRAVTKSLSTGQLTSKAGWKPYVPIVNQIKDFPFAPLLDLQFESDTTKVCKAV